MAQGRVRKGVEKSIAVAVSCGNLDLSVHAAPLAMLRYMADFLDRADGETPPFRYVTPASFLSYCETLGLTPKNEPAAKPSEGDDGQSSLKQMRSKFRVVGEG